MGIWPFQQKSLRQQDHWTSLQYVRLTLISLSIVVLLALLPIIGHIWSRPHDGKQHPLVSPIVKANTLPSPTPTLPPPNVLGFPLSGGNPDLPEVALTFDDGPNPVSTPQILSLLQRSGASATFYVIGSQAQTYPALIKQEAQSGHLVGNHSWTHPQLTSLSSSMVFNELQHTSQAIQASIGSLPIVFRPPYGLYNNSVQEIAARLGLSTVLWSVDSRDWSKPGTNAIIQTILSTTHNGSIILLHDGGGDRSQTVAALPTILTTLTQRGFRFVTVDRLIHDLPHDGTKPTQQAFSQFSPQETHPDPLSWFISAQEVNSDRRRVSA